MEISSFPHSIRFSNGQTKFNFAIDVVEFWAKQPSKMEAMRWLSNDKIISHAMTFEYFLLQSRRISVLLNQLGVKRGDIIIIITPRVPA